MYRAALVARGYSLFLSAEILTPGKRRSRLFEPLGVALKHRAVPPTYHLNLQPPGPVPTVSRAAPQQLSSLRLKTSFRAPYCKYNTLFYLFFFWAEHIFPLS